MKEATTTAAHADGAANVVRGAVLMSAAAALFAVMTVLVRYVSAELPPFEIAFFRWAFGAVVMIPWAIGRGRAMLRTSRPGVQGVRAILSVIATLIWFTALTVLPLAQAVALNFTVPLFATIGAALVLGEVVRLRRWSATAIGFAGVLVIVRPGFDTVSVATLLPIIAALVMACAVLVTKMLARTDSTETMVLYNTCLTTAMLAFVLPFVWTTPSWPAIGWLFLMGAVATGAHLMLTQAFHLADASLVIPFDYTRLPLVAALGFAFFDEIPDVWTWVGGLVIAGATIYIARREAMVARERATHRPAASPSAGPGAV